MLARLSRFWKIVITFIGVLILSIGFLGVLTGIHSKGGKEETLAELGKDSMADVKDAEKSLKKKGGTELKEEIYRNAVRYIDKTPSKSDMTTFLKDYSVKMVEDGEVVSDGLYVFYNRDLNSADVVKEKVSQYIKNDSSYPVTSYYMNVEDSAIAGFSFIDKVMGDEDIWETHDYPLAVFVQYGVVKGEYPQGDKLADLPRKFKGGSE